MKIEDLEKALQYFVIAVPENEEQAKAYFWARKGISALCSTPQPGKPLTLNQLRKMDGQPVWCEDVERWALVSVSDAGKWKGVPFALFVRDGGRFEWDIEDRNLSLYSYSPEQVGRERWSGCLICRGTKYMYGDAVSGYGTREVRGGVVFHYCPMCGRPLSHEAWDEMDRMLKDE